MRQLPWMDRRVRNIALLVVVLLGMNGCSGITPDENGLRNNREEGPEKGLFTGSRGEFVILSPEEKSADKQTSTESSKEAEAAQ